MAGALLGGTGGDEEQAARAVMLKAAFSVAAGGA